jgi:hypothetical protein
MILVPARPSSMMRQVGTCCKVSGNMVATGSAR